MWAAQPHRRTPPPGRFSLGIVLLAAVLILEAGATRAVKAVKMSAELVAGQPAARAGITQVEPERMGSADE